MAVAAPVITAEMADWTRLGGGNSGIVGDAAHAYGFHCAANEIPASDYSRARDPNGADGPFTRWDYACAGDFAHRNDERLRGMHRAVLARLMRGELPMIAEFIGQPWSDRPVYYWARWNGVGTLQRYTGDGHDTWSHIAWYRSRANQRAYLWTPGSGEDDMFNDDTVPVKYPTEDPNNKTWRGPAALGHARDLVHETRDLVRELHDDVDKLAAAVDKLAAGGGVDAAPIVDAINALRDQLAGAARAEADALAADKG